ncbi:MAG: transglutaminase family protein [Pseudomonadales bacterium]
MDESLLEAFQDCAEDPAADEVRMAILVARTLDPAVRGDRVEARLGALAALGTPGQAPWELLREQGFAGNLQNYSALENSNIAWVLEHRRGIPISLAVVLIRLARQAGHSATGMNYPGHFLVQIDEVIVDPFVLQPVTRQQLLEQLPDDVRARPASQLFAPASTVAVGLRMLNNVKLAHLNAAAWHRALEAVDAQLRLAPRHSSLHLERGDLWRRMGLIQPARVAYAEALALADELPPAAAEEVRRAVQARLDDLGGASDIVH